MRHRHIPDKTVKSARTGSAVAGGTVACTAADAQATDSSILLTLKTIIHKLENTERLIVFI
jgi:hypothetical protein